tara:strand:- start:15 stop:275 length:261 start_codon:yes stop_codon:yes gene_type:complete
MSNEFKRQVDLIEQRQLTINPYVGKPLGNKFLREKKIVGKRVYYLINEGKKEVRFMSISGNKDQQRIIAWLKQMKKFKQILLLFRL